MYVHPYFACKRGALAIEITIMILEMTQLKNTPSLVYYTS